MSDLRDRVIREITVAPGWNKEDATALVDALLAEAAPPPLDGPDDPEWPYSFIVNRREYEALVKRARKIEGAAIRLMKVLDLASSVHTSERRAARLALGAALRDEGGTT